MILLTIIEFLKVDLINEISILKMSVEMATSGIFKMALFLNKSCGVIKKIHDAIKIIWPKFDYSSISMTEVNIT